MNTSLVCVCTSGRGRCGCRTPRNSKTARRRRVRGFTHAPHTFISLLLAVSSSSVSKRLVILHAIRAWLYDEQLDNDLAEVAADG